MLKDLNYCEINKDINLMHLSLDQYDSLDKVLELDSIFLSKHNLMDYSLLLIIEQIDKNDSGSSSVARKSSLNFDLDSGWRNIIVGARVKYHIGIIDFLQDWSYLKKFESFYKISTGNDPKEISAVNPVRYQKRFHHFMQN